MKWIKEEMIKSRGNKEQGRKDRWGTLTPPPFIIMQEQRDISQNLSMEDSKFIQKETHFHTIYLWKARLHDVVNPAGLSRGLGTSLDLEMLKNI